MTTRPSDLPAPAGAASAAASPASAPGAAAATASAPEAGLLELPDALASALAEAEAFAVRSETRAAVHRLTGGDERDEASDAPAPDEGAPAAPREAAPRSFGPNVRGLALDDRATAALRAQTEALRAELAAAQQESARHQREAEAARADLRATRQRFQRVADQLDELRRRLERAETELPAKTSRRLLLALLPALDSQHTVLRALERDEGVGADARGAVAMLRGDWERGLQAQGVVAFDAEGQRFDPAVHEAIARVAASGEGSAGRVVRQVGRGYLLEGRLLRPAQVVVADADG